MLAVTLSLLLSFLLQAASTESSTERVAFLVPIAADASWLDDAFLAAIPAASAICDGKPIVVAVRQDQPWLPEVEDFLRRLQPQRLYWLGPKPSTTPTPWATTIKFIPVSNAFEAAVEMSTFFNAPIKQLVMYPTDDRAAALSASALAARLGAPLLPISNELSAESVLDWMKKMQCKHALWVGSAKKPGKDVGKELVKAGIVIEKIKNSEAVARWMVKHGLKVEYLAAVNSMESAAGRNRHLSLAAPLLAAGRSGAVAALPYATKWKQRIDTSIQLEKASNGAADSSMGWHQGTLADGKKTHNFIAGRNPQNGRWWMQFDDNGDGKYSGRTEQPLHTGANFIFAKQNWCVDLEADEANRGKAIWLTSPTTAEIQSDLNRFHQAAKFQPRYLCLVGWPDALPMSIVSNGQGIDCDLVSDLPFAQTDDDPFIELAFARFVAADLTSATLLACRGFTRNQLPEQQWAQTFTTAEWAGACVPELKEAGLNFLGHHPEGKPFETGSPLSKTGLIMHGSHAMWTVLGTTYAWNSSTLLAPALVTSEGCSTASLDQDPEHRSVATQLLKNGAVAFVGNTRRGVAQQSLYISAFMNAVLAGNSIGDAQKHALNQVTLAVLEHGQSNGGLYYYQRYNQAVFGDPALQIDLPGLSFEHAAAVQQKGRQVTVTGPKKWHRFDYEPLAEWGCNFPTLYTWRGAGVAYESSWHNQEKRNQDDLYVNVQARTRSSVNSVEQLTKTPANLGWIGKCYVDEHADGSRSLHWRVRMLDADMTSGKINQQLDRVQFRLIRN
ncbi:MAG: hypothetical protein HQ519_05950 [Planctomycetes bacterium]|nr:hypothetical protein [Planctomycetota bacterium]